MLACLQEFFIKASRPAWPGVVAHILLAIKTWVVAASGLADHPNMSGGGGGKDDSQ